MSAGILELIYSARVTGWRRVGCEFKTLSATHPRCSQLASGFQLAPFWSANRS